MNAKSVRGTPNFSNGYYSLCQGLGDNVTYPVNSLNNVIASGVASTPHSSLSAVLTISSSAECMFAIASFEKSVYFFGNMPDWSTKELFCPMISSQCQLLMP